MKFKKALFSCATAAIIVLVAVRIVSTPTARTKVYFAASRAAYTHTPLRRVFNRIDIPALLSPIAQPFEPVWMEVEPGMEMQLDPYDLVSRTILETGEWEPESVHAMTEHLSANGVFIDVGAHVGFYTLKAANLVGPNGHVLAVEPNPETLPKLQANIKASNARSVSVWPVACASTESTLSLYAAPRQNTGESSLSKENASQAGPATTAYSVRARPLDDIIKEAKLDRVDVIKIDVEGAEFDVLKGSAQTLAQYRPVLIIEVIPRQLQSMGASVEELMKFMTSCGYKVGRQLDGINVEFVPAKT